MSLSAANSFNPHLNISVRLQQGNFLFLISRKNLKLYAQQWVLQLQNTANIFILFLHTINKSVFFSPSTKRKSQCESIYINLYCVLSWGCKRNCLREVDEKQGISLLWHNHLLVPILLQSLYFLVTTAVRHPSVVYK